MSTKTKSADKMFTKGGGGGGGGSTTKIGLWCLDAIKMEIAGGRSSLLLAFAGAIHLNDFLHSAGLITDDAWNAVKGMSTLFSESANITAISGSIGSVLKTVVEASETAVDTFLGGGGASPSPSPPSSPLTKLSALGGAAAEETA